MNMEPAAFPAVQKCHIKVGYFQAVKIFSVMQDLDTRFQESKSVQFILHVLMFKSKLLLFLLVLILSCHFKVYLKSLTPNRSLQKKSRFAILLKLEVLPHLQ